MLTGKGDGSFTYRGDFPTGKQPADMVSEDFNNDGATDIALRNYGKGTISVLLNTARTFVRLHSSKNPSTVGESVAFTVTVQGSVIAAPVPSGVVTLMDGSKMLGRAKIAEGTTTVTVSKLAAGEHKIQAIYSGNATFNRNESAVFTQTVK